MEHEATKDGQANWNGITDTISISGEQPRSGSLGWKSERSRREGDRLCSFEVPTSWSRIYSLWPVHLTTACCSPEFGAMMSGRYDPERFGMQAAVGSMRQSDLLIIEGTVTKKTLKRIEVIWQQMPNPKYAIAMGDCACSGGLFHDSYSIINEIEKAIPIDVYVPGCPSRPEAVLNAVLKLREKIRREQVYSK